MLELPGYAIVEAIHRGTGTVVYRAYREYDQLPVVLKMVTSSDPSARELARLHNDYELTHNLAIAGVVHAYALEQSGHMLVLEDSGGVTLNELSGSSAMDFATFLPIALQLVETLGQVHQAGIIHKNIQAGNVFYNPATGMVKLSDFGIAVRLPPEARGVYYPTRLEGTLAYMSPEQTGRMNRLVDYRTDLYALGVTFYLLLTGQLPFLATDPTELIHAHIARHPLPLRSLVPELPPALDSIVMKLLAKAAEERYQSADGLKADLQECLTRWTTHGSIGTLLPGHADRYDRFDIPQRLYGREQELSVLIDLFRRSRRSKREVLLVSGSTGSGKSSLVQEMQKTVMQAHGYFISGTFDHVQQTTPYSAIMQALETLAERLLTENAERLAHWRTQLLEALGANVRLLIHLSPTFASIVGQSPAAIGTFQATESLDRYSFVLQRFLKVFAQVEHPLLLVLDNLQWADEASLRCLELILTTTSNYALFVIGVFRDEDVGWQHPLRATLNVLSGTGVQIHHLSLDPMNLSAVTQLIADTFRCSVADATPLAILVYEKTGGYPFFVRAFLDTLYIENLVRYDFSLGWQWDLDAIRPVQIPSNIVELMLHRLSRLSLQTQQILKSAACIGRLFDLDLLAQLYQHNVADTLDHLAEALRERLVLHCDEGYAFYHERVREAAYALLSPDEQEYMHYQLGQLLLQSSASAELPDHIFAIVEHLNSAARLVSGAEARLHLAELNLAAGHKARLTAAYEAALRYFAAGLHLLDAQTWQSDYDLTLALHMETIAMSYLTDNDRRAEELAREVLRHATGLPDRARVYEVRMQAVLTRHQAECAVAIGLEALEVLGIPLEQQSNAHNHTVDPECQNDTLPALDDLARMPITRNPDHLAVMRLFMTLAAPALETRPDLFARVVRSQVRYGIEHGYTPPAAYAYAMYGLYLIVTHDAIDQGYHAGQIALRLLDSCDDVSLNCKVVYLFNAHIRHWRDPLRDTLDALQEGTRLGLDSGDFQYASYSARALCVHLFCMSERLEEVARQQVQALELVQSLRQEDSAMYLQIWQQTVLNLQDRATTHTRLYGDSFRVEEVLPDLQATHNRSLVFAIYLNELVLAYWFGEYERAAERVQQAAEYVDAAAGLINLGMFTFFRALALLACYPCFTSDQQSTVLHQVNTDLARMRRWPSITYQHACDLVEAERARVLHQVERAMEYYDRAITSAMDQHVTSIAGLACERAATFYLDIGRQRIAQVYLKDSHYWYTMWGAIALIKALEQQYAWFFDGMAVGSGQEDGHMLTHSGAHTPTGSASVALDLSTVLKVSQAISSEMDCDLLLEKLMCAAIEHAGACRGLLLLEQGGNLVIQAEGHVDSKDVTVLQAQPVESFAPIAITIVNYVRRTGESLAIADARQDGRFATDAYIMEQRPGAILCVPILWQAHFRGILYLENNLPRAAFTPDRIEMMHILSAQAAISLENARLYAEMKQEMSERKRAEEALRTLAEGTATVTGDDFFRSLVRYVASIFDVRFAFIGEVTDQTHTRVRTLAFLEDGQIQANCEYDLIGTPCKDVIEGHICFYPDRLNELFAGNADMRSYLGIPLRTSDGVVSGHLAILDVKPMHRTSHDMSILKIFAARAGVELERQHAGDALRRNEEALRQSETQLRRLNEQLADYNRNLEQKVAERTHEIERRRQVAERLRDMLAILNSNRSLAQILDYIVAEGIKLLGTESGAIYRLDADRRLFVVQASRGIVQAYIDNLSFSTERSFLGDAVRQRRPVAVTDLAGTLATYDLALPPQKKQLLIDNYRTLLAVPLMQQSGSVASDAIYGGIALYYAEMRHFSDDELGLVITFADQATLAIENAILRQQIQQAAISEERSRLARELHDSVTQSLYSLTLLAEGWRRLAENGRLESITASLAELGQIGQQALKEMRLLVHELRPPALEKEGLLGALHQRLGAVERRAGVEARLLADADELVLDTALEECLYRIAQEALNNALKHAAATAVTVHIRAPVGRIELEVVDNGQGFDLQAIRAQGGVGLQSMRERTEQLGGIWQIESSPGVGTSVRAIFDATRTELW